MFQQNAKFNPAKFCTHTVCMSAYNFMLFDILPVKNVEKVFMLLSFHT